MNEFKIQDTTQKTSKDEELSPRKKSKVPWIIGVIVISCILFGDVALGRFSFYSLCAAYGGEKIYKTVELPAEYWRENGEPVFLDEKGINKVKSKLNGYYSFRSKQIKNIRLDPQIIGYEKTIKDKQTGEILATDTVYHYYGGWLINSQPFNVSGIHCPIGKSGDYGRFLKKIFLKQKNNLPTGGVL